MFRFRGDPQIIIYLAGPPQELTFQRCALPVLMAVLVFFLTNLGSTIGTLVGGAEILSNLG